MSDVLMGFVGDMFVNREEPEDAFRNVRDLLKAPHVMFGNLEGAYTDKPHRAPSATISVGAPAHNLNVFSKVGFSVLSMASNHILDMGYDALEETRSRLRVQGIKTCGAGHCATDARQPAIVDAGEISVAFLAYGSVFPLGYEARWNVPGLAPMRSYNYLRDSDPGYYPGGDQPLVVSIPDQGDLANLTEDIRLARNRSDLVIVSFHWGDDAQPYHLTEHETRTARHCIDHGADMVIGHHQHALRGMQWYKGKPIMYGLGHFVVDFRLELGDEIEKAFLAAGGEDATYRVGPRKGWPLLPLHKDTRMTVMAWAVATREGIRDIGFLPCRLTADGLVHPLSLDSPDGREVASYLDKCNSSQGLDTAIITDGAPLIAGLRTLRVVPR